jgi:hypothetical protein
MDYVSTFAYYWSSTVHDSNGAYRLYYYSGNLSVTVDSKFYGFQVRCVK